MQPALAGQRARAQGVKTRDGDAAKQLAASRAAPALQPRSDDTRQRKWLMGTVRRIKRVIKAHWLSPN